METRFHTSLRENERINSNGPKLSLMIFPPPPEIHAPSPGRTSMSSSSRNAPDDSGAQTLPPFVVFKRVPAEPTIQPVVGLRKPRPRSATLTLLDWATQLAPPSVDFLMTPTAAPSNPYPT